MLKTQIFGQERELKLGEEVETEFGQLVLTQFKGENYQSHYWYGGLVAAVKYKDYTFVLSADGIVDATLIEDGITFVSMKDKYNIGRFYDEAHEYIESDKELYELVKKGTLAFVNNNWFEILAYKNGYHYDLEYVSDASLLSEAIKEMCDVDNLEACIRHIEESENVC